MRIGLYPGTFDPLTFGHMDIMRRAAILVALLELSEKEIDSVYEKPGSLKIGNYLPGTRIPIRSDEELIPHLPKTEVILNLAWHIPKEIEIYLRKQGYKGELINIV